MDTNDLKIMHQQFIELAISLAKAGIITTFDSKCCGANNEAFGIILKYYLEPGQIKITEDLDITQEAV